MDEHDVLYGANLLVLLLNLGVIAWLSRRPRKPKCTCDSVWLTRVSRDSYEFPRPEREFYEILERHQQELQRYRITHFR